MHAPQHAARAAAAVGYHFDLQVFQGMSMAAPEKIPDEINMQRLWVHECQRTFADRLINDQDRHWFTEQIGHILQSTFKRDIKTVVEREPLIYADYMETVWRGPGPRAGAGGVEGEGYGSCRAVSRFVCAVGDVGQDANGQDPLPTEIFAWRQFRRENLAQALPPEEDLPPPGQKGQKLGDASNE